MNDLPTTNTAPVHAVATVLRLLGGQAAPTLNGMPRLAAVSIERIAAIDFYPANPTTTERKTA